MEKQNGNGKKEGKGLRVWLVCACVRACVRLSFVFPFSCVKDLLLELR
jgi:hypothetical protein